VDAAKSSTAFEEDDGEGRDPQAASSDKPAICFLDNSGYTRLTPGTWRRCGR
jgi:hypothetical protein